MTAKGVNSKTDNISSDEESLSHGYDGWSMPTQPQDLDPVDELVTQVHQWKQRINSLKSKESNHLQRRCRQKAAQAKKLKIKLNEMLSQAKKRISEARELVKINIISEKNTDGVLMGRVDDYVKDLDEVINNANS